MIQVNFLPWKKCFACILRCAHGSAEDHKKKGLTKFATDNSIRIYTFRIVLLEDSEDKSWGNADKHGLIKLILCKGYLTLIALIK